MALFFAAQGRGIIRPFPNGKAEPYVSTARVLINGLGSDELLGGYGRFRTAFKYHGWTAIVKEVSRKWNLFVHALTYLWKAPIGC